MFWFGIERTLLGTFAPFLRKKSHLGRVGGQVEGPKRKVVKMCVKTSSTSSRHRKKLFDHQNFFGQNISNRPLRVCRVDIWVFRALWGAVEQFYQVSGGVSSFFSIWPKVELVLFFSLFIFKVEISNKRGEIAFFNKENRNFHF